MQMVIILVIISVVVAGWSYYRLSQYKETKMPDLSDVWEYREDLEI